MSIILISRHDYLGKLAIIKNYLSVVLSDNRLPSDIKEKVKTAYDTNDNLIQSIKDSPAVESSI